MKELINILHQKAQKQADDIREYRIKLIATHNDYKDLENYWRMYEEGMLDLESYKNIERDILDMIERRWGVGVENN